MHAQLLDCDTQTQRCTFAQLANVALVCCGECSALDTIGRTKSPDITRPAAVPPLHKKGIRGVALPSIKLPYGLYALMQARYDF